MNKSYETFKKLSSETLQKRQQNIRTLKLRYPTRIPIIVYTKNNAIPITEKSKFLVEDKVTVAEFIHVLRKYVKIQQQESIFLFKEDWEGGDLVNANVKLGSKKILDSRDINYHANKGW